MVMASGTLLANNAHYAVRRALRLGLLPKPETLLCIDFCGKQASDYDHYVGYEANLVHPVCRSCHMKREVTRGTFLVTTSPTCSKGHDPSNFFLEQGKYRRCRVCKNEESRRYHVRKRREVET